MKKVGILTHYYKSKNIGGLLQSYALPALLNKNDYQAEQISFDMLFKDYKAKKTVLLLRLYEMPLLKFILWFFGKSLFSRVKRFIKNSQNKKINKFVQTQNKVFEEFEKFIPHSQEKYNTSNIQNANKNYDVFVVGSDQVFSTYLLPLAAYFGEFAGKDKKVIAYAASSNVKKFVPKTETLFLYKLQRFNQISVREKTLKDYIENVSDKKAQVVLDPTFLLSPQEWLEIANPKVIPNKKYIFCYFLGEKSAWQRQVAQSYADKYGYDLVHLPYIIQSIRQADKCLKGRGLYNVGPREFIALINKAECVFTDSFHGLAFSINFGKNFYVFNRDDKTNEKSMNARITDTLKMFGLTKRHITDKGAVLDNTPISYTKAHEILEQEKQKSINWLLDSLKE